MIFVAAMWALPHLYTFDPLDWVFEQSGAVCTAELPATSAPAGIVLLKDAADRGYVYVKLANPAWSVQPSSSRELSIHYTMLPYRDQYGRMQPAIHVDLPATPVDSRTLVETTGGRQHGALAFMLPRKQFDEIADNARFGLRVAIYQKDQALTNWIKVDDRVRRSLDRCTDTLAN